MRTFYDKDEVARKEARRQSTLKWRRQWLKTEKGRKYGYAYQKEWIKKNPKRAKEIASKSGKKYNLNLRLACLNYYSKGLLDCTCCGEKMLQFLSIDHIEGGGRRHREEIGNMYRWLISNSFPEGYQVLCHNCNLAKGFYGQCPHKLT